MEDVAIRLIDVDIDVHYRACRRCDVGWFWIHGVATVAVLQATDFDVLLSLLQIFDEDDMLIMPIDPWLPDTRATVHSCRLFWTHSTVVVLLDLGFGKCCRSVCADRILYIL